MNSKNLEYPFPTMSTSDDTPRAITPVELIEQLDELFKRGHFGEARRVVEEVVAGSPQTDVAAHSAYLFARCLNREGRAAEAREMLELAANQDAGYWSGKAMYDLAHVPRTPRKEVHNLLARVIELAPHGAFAAQAAAVLAGVARKRYDTANISRLWRRWRELLKATLDVDSPEENEDLEALHLLAEDAWMVAGDAAQARAYANELLTKAAARCSEVYVSFAKRTLRAIQRGVPFTMSLEDRRATKAGRGINSRAAFDAARLYHMYDHGEYAAADVLAEALIQEHPGTDIAARAATWRAWSRRLRNDHTGQVADLRVAMGAKSPQHSASAALSLGYSLRQRNRLEEAVAVLTDLVDRWPTSEHAPWAYRELERMAPNDVEAQRWRMLCRKALEAVAARRDRQSDADLEALWDLVHVTWNFASEAGRNAEAARGYARQLLEQSIGRRNQSRHQQRARRALAAISKGVSSWSVPREK